MFNIVYTYTTTQTAKQAQLFAIALAERGYTSQVIKKSYGHVVVDSENKAVEFIRR